MSADDLKEWDVLPNGEVRFDQAVAFGVAAVNPHFVLLRMDYATSQAELDRWHATHERPQRLQVAMSPETALALADRLVRYAKGLQSTVPSRDRQN